MNLYPHFLIHGSIGAAIMCLGYCWFNDRKGLIWVASIGAIVGMLPDLPIAGWYNWAHQFHYIEILFLPWLAHVLYDIPLHKAGDWWSTYWWLEIGLWIISLTINWYFLIRRKTDEIPNR